MDEFFNEVGRRLSSSLGIAPPQEERLKSPGLLKDSAGLLAKEYTRVKDTARWRASELFVVLTKDGDQVNLIALTKKGFALVWKQPIENPGKVLLSLSLSTQHLCIGDVCYVGIAHSFLGFDIATGELLFRVDKDDHFEAMVVFSESLVIVAYRKQIIAYSLTGSEAWQTELDGDPGSLRHISALCLCDEKLFACNGTMIFALRPLYGKLLFKKEIVEWEPIASGTIKSAILADPAPIVEESEQRMLYVSARGYLMNVDPKTGFVCRKTQLYEDKFGGSLGYCMPKLSRWGDILVVASNNAVHGVDPGTHKQIFKTGLPTKDNFLTPLIPNIAIVGKHFFVGLRGHVFELSQEKGTAGGVLYDFQKEGVVSLCPVGEDLLVGLEGKISVMNPSTFHQFMIHSQMDFSIALGQCSFAWPAHDPYVSNPAGYWLI